MLGYSPLHLDLYFCNKEDLIIRLNAVRSPSLILGELLAVPNLPLVS